MPNYREGVQTPITFRVYATDGSPYTTSGTPPTLLVQKNRSGAPASATGTLSHAGSGLWSYTPAAGEVSASCSLLHLMWSGSGMAAGDVAIEFENDFTPTVSGRIDATISSRSTLAAADVRTAVGLASANLDSQLAAIAGYLDTEVAAILSAVDTEVAAIKAKTDALPTDPADASDIAASFANITTLLNTLAGYVDTEVAAILTAVDTEVAAIKAKTDALPDSPAAVGSAMTLATNSVTAAALASDAVAEIAGGISASTTTRILAMPLRSGRSEAVRYTRGAEGPDLLEHILDGMGGRVDLTGYTITASLIRIGTEASVFTDAAASLGNAPEEGQVVLDWPADSLDTPGQYRLIWTATKAGADTLTWQTLVVVE
jgi:hypothetical protein